MCFGYAKLSYIETSPALLITASFTIGEGSKVVSAEIDNFGVKASKAGLTFKILAGNTEIASATAPAFAAYEKKSIDFTPSKAIPAGTTSLTLAAYDGSKEVWHSDLRLSDALAARDKLTAAIAEAQGLVGNADYNYGKDALQAAIDEAKNHEGSFDEAELSSAVEALRKAILAFGCANASKGRPMTITIENADMSSLEGWEIQHAGTGGDFHINANNNKNYNKLGSTPFAEAYNGKGVTKPNYIRQTLAGLPAGTYGFEVDVIAQNGSGGANGVEIFINESKTACSSTQANYSRHYSVTTTVEESGEVTFGLNITSSSNATWVALDNATLLYYGDGTHDDEPYYTASIETIYISGNGQKANHYVTVEPDHDHYLNRLTTPNENSVWAKITDTEKGNIWLYNVATKSFIIPEGTFWKTSKSKASKVIALEQTGTGWQIQYLASGSNRYMNAYGGFGTSRDIVAGLKGFPIGAHTSGVWDFTTVEGQEMPDIDLEAILTGYEEFKNALAKLPKAAVIEVPAGGYSIFCAPFEVTLPEGVTAKQVGAVVARSAENVPLEDFGSNVIPANTPVVLYSEEGCESKYVSGSEQAQSTTCTSDGGAITGVLTAKATAPAGSYIVNNGQLIRTDTETTVAKNSGYITVSGNLSIAPEIAVNNEAEEVYYNIYGQRVSKDTKGLLISRNRKIFNR